MDLVQLYRRKARDLHPDCYQHPKATEALQIINEVDQWVTD